MGGPFEIWIRQKPQGMWMLFQVKASREQAEEIISQRKQVDPHREYELREPVRASLTPISIDIPVETPR